MLKFSDEDLKEIFAVFSSPTKYEFNQINNPGTDVYYKSLILKEEYELNMPKREFAIDALRAVLYFLTKNGYEIKKDNKKIDLTDIIDLFYNDES